MKYFGWAVITAATGFLSLGCPGSGGTWYEDQTIAVDDSTRYFRYYVPADLTGPHPVVFL